jgi:nucleoid DNA-binding protein
MLDQPHAKASAAPAASFKSAWNQYELSRPQATKVVNVIFDSIAAALKKGEKVTIPIGTLEVLEQTRPPLRRWFLGRVRVTYAQRKRIKFTPAKGLLEPGSGGVKKAGGGGKANA